MSARHANALVVYSGFFSTSSPSSEICISSLTEMGFRPPQAARF